MNIQVTHDGKTYNFENGSEAFIFDIGICHEMRDNHRSLHGYIPSPGS